MDILLLEDDPNDADLTLRALKRANSDLEIKWLEDGEEALDFLFENTDLILPKLILLDVKLPKISGIQLLDKIKNSDLNTIPVVMFSSSEISSDIEKCRKLGAQSFIVKPTSLKEYREKINNLIAKYF